jgi:hypothetical protein
MGRRRRDGNYTPQYNNSTEYSEGNEKMDTQLLTPTK